MVSKADQIALLQAGPALWNKWRQDNPELRPNLQKSDFSYSDLRGADLSNANLREADFLGADLSGANLSGADLSLTRLVGTNFEGANLSNCIIHGISAWNVNLKGAVQTNLTITRPKEATITIDDLEVAQFVYLLINNTKLREVIDTITSKVVLILGRFTPERKAVLDALREVLRRHNYLPVLFDFEKPDNRDLTETVATLAHLSRFIIADITSPRSIPQELQAIVPTLRVPIQPLLQESEREYGLFRDFTKYPWVLDPYRYATMEELIAALPGEIITRIEGKLKEFKKD
jgi:uncharacterized protein YjbI with pentapeptide repeats